ncbi:MAG: hypothetical protein NT140_08965 [Deltaproteobacteria bacterium]|nr:hypothetical protein [Deltaproteobacteria bacterium]
MMPGIRERVAALESLLLRPVVSIEKINEAIRQIDIATGAYPADEQEQAAPCIDNEPAETEMKEGILPCHTKDQQGESKRKLTRYKTSLESTDC